jgi:hypothetical protein
MISTFQEKLPDKVASHINLIYLKKEKKLYDES